MSAPVVREEIARLFLELRSREAGLSVDEADLLDATERWLLDAELEDDDADDNKRRDYRDAKGRKLPGVTGVIGNTCGWSKEALSRWAAREAATAAAEFMLEGAALADAIQRAKFSPFGTRDRAAEAGTVAHAMCESYLKTGIAPDDDPFLPSETMVAARAAFERFRAWWRTVEHLYEVVHVELAITDHELCVGGTIDSVLRRKSDGAIFVGDLKTGKGIYDECVLQLGAYAVLLLRRHQLKAHAAIIMHCPLDGEFSAVDVTGEMLTLGGAAFLSLLGVYQARKQLTLKKEGSK